MIKNRVALLAICFALFIIATGCSNKSVNNTEAANANSARSAESNSGVNTFSSPTGTPTLNTSPRTVQVRLTEVETNADLIDSPLSNSKIIVKAGETSFNKKTDKDGVVVFDSVPCGNEIVITAHDEESDEDTVLHTRLGCAGTQVDLGVLTRPFGGKFILEQRKPQYMEYDPIKNVWRSEGTVVPMEKVRGILEKYMPK